MKLSLIHSVGLIAKAISSSVRKQGFQFSRKQELMGVMMVESLIRTSLMFYMLYFILLYTCSLVESSFKVDEMTVSVFSK